MQHFSDKEIVCSPIKQQFRKGRENSNGAKMSFCCKNKPKIVLDEDGLVAANFRCSTSQIRDCLFTKQTQQFQPFHIKKLGHNCFYLNLLFAVKVAFARSLAMC
jgi:hypothetical protein